MKRRNFIKNSLTLASSAWLSTLLKYDYAFSQNIIDENFLIVITFDGGWTTNLSIDPWLGKRPEEKDIFLEYTEDEIFKSGNLFFGPAMKSLKNYTHDMCVINGIFMNESDNGHIPAQIYATSGNPSGSYGNLAVEFEYNSITTTPYGVFNNGSLYTGITPIYSSNVSELNSLDEGEGINIPFQNPDSPITKALNIKKNNQAQINKVLKSKQDLQLNNITVNEYHLLALSYKYGLSKSSSFLLYGEGTSLDTHASHPQNHLKAQMSCWEQVKTIFDAFKSIEYKDGQSMYDKTTFLITSEFSRTPALDSSQGTNHNPLCNSAVIIGPRLVKNQKIGASRLVTANESKTNSSYLTSQMINSTTFEVAKTKDEAMKVGTLLGPEYVIATVAEGLNIQRNIFQALHLDQKPIQGLIR